MISTCPLSYLAIKRTVLVMFLRLNVTCLFYTNSNCVPPPDNYHVKAKKKAHVSTIVCCRVYVIQLRELEQCGVNKTDQAASKWQDDDSGKSAMVF